MKDPLHEEKTPYDVLSVDRNITQKEIQKSLIEYMKKRKKIPEGMDAAKKLRNIRDRIEVDILYYCLDDIEIKGTPEFNIAIQDFVNVPVLNLDNAFNDLKKDFSEESKDINFRTFRLNDLERYNDLKDCKLKVVFDK